MKNDTVEIIGVYRLEKEYIKDYDELLNPENAENVVIIEMVIKKPLQDIDISEITQANDSLPRDCWQVVYDEIFLNESGMEVISEQDYFDAGYESTRFVFFFHDPDFDKPMQTPFGDVPLMKPTKMPQRLEGKIEYWEP